MRYIFESLFHELVDATHRSAMILFGLMCFLAFLANAGLLFWLIVKKQTFGLARCPKCGRPIACPICEEDEHSKQQRKRRKEQSKRSSAASSRNQEET